MIVFILDFNSFAFKGNTLVVKLVYANKNTFVYLCQYKLGSLDYAIGSKKFTPGLGKRNPFQFTFLI